MFSRGEPRAFAAGLLLLATIACGGSEGTERAAGDAGVLGPIGNGGGAGNEPDAAMPIANSDGATQSMGLAPACSAYASAYCAFLQKCQPAAVFDIYGGVPECQATQTTICTDRVGAPGVTATAADLGACAQDLSQRTCDLAINPQSKCAYQGTFTDGAACRYDAQCQSGLCKVASYNSTCGVCGAPAGAGEPCHQSNGCALPLHCSLAGDTRETCVRSDPAGTTCDPHLDTCAYSLGCTANKCQQPPGLGQPCDAVYVGCYSADDSECIGGICVKMMWVHEGDACDIGKQILCVAGLRCSDDTGPGMCNVSPRPPPVLADACK